MRNTLALVSFALLTCASLHAEDYFGGELRAIQTYSLGEAAALGGGFNAAKEYSNVSSFSGQAVVNGGTESQGGNLITRLIADDITPLGLLGGMDVTELRFSVANLNAGTVSARPRLRFWYDGPGGAPGLYYDKPMSVGFTFNPINIPAGVTTYTFAPAADAFDMPAGTFWAGITFDNNTGATGATLAQMNNLGMGIFGPPDTGASADKYFRTSSAGSFFQTDNPLGGLLDFGGTPVANFGWEFTAAPEPHSLALMALALALLVRRR
jgi:hypothetical protein